MCVTICAQEVSFLIKLCVVSSALFMCLFNIHMLSTRICSKSAELLQWSLFKCKYDHRGSHSYFIACFKAILWFLIWKETENELFLSV